MKRDKEWNFTTTKITLFRKFDTKGIKNKVELNG